MHIKVLNRWGDLIFKSNSAAWDGRTNDGKAASDGTYFYQIKFKQTGNKEQLKNGQVTLIRSKNASKSSYE